MSIPQDSAAKALVELALRRQAEDDFYTFVKLAWPHIEGRKFVDGWVLQVLCEHLEEVFYGRIKRLNINLPPRMAKSSLVSILFQCWCWIKDPSLQFLGASYSEKLAVRDNTRARRLLKSPWFQARWGNRITLSDDQDTKMRVDNMQNGYRIAVGLGGTVRGEGADCLVRGTMVATTIGDVPIETITENPTKYKAYSYDFLLDKVVISDIVASLTRKRIADYEIFVNEGNSIRCTANHRLYIQGRGFIAASKIKVGERVLFARREKGFCRSYLCKLWERGEKKYLCHKKIYKPEKSGILLWECVQEIISFKNKFTPMFDMWMHKAHKGYDILLAFLQIASKEDEEKTTNSQEMCGMRRRVFGASSKAQVLLKKMFKCSPFKKYDGKPKPTLRFKQGSISLQSAFFQNETADNGTRWLSLCSMLKKWIQKNIIREYKNFFAYTSFGWKEKESFPRKSYNPMRFLSHETPCWKFRAVSSIRKNNEDEQCVYDIQIKRTHNFFANGILVHNCIVLDDINDVTDRSEVQLENAIEFYTQVIPTRYNDFKTGRLINVQQRLHMRDVSGYIIANQSKEFVNLILPMEFEESRRCITVPLKSTNGLPWQDPRTEEGELLWPERIGEKELRTLKAALGSEMAVAGQLQQRPAPAEGGMIKRAWWMPWKQESSPRVSFVIQAWDTGSSVKKSAAYSACTTWGIFNNDHGHPCLILLGAWRKKVEVPELYKQVARMARDYRSTSEDRLVNELFRPDIVLVEEKASGIPVLQSLKRTGIQIVGWRPDKFGDKIERVRKVTPLIESGRVYVPYRAPDFTKMKSYADMLVEQAAVFPRGDSRDMIDTVSMVLQRCIVSGWVLHPLENSASQQDEWRRDHIGQEEKGFY